MVKSPAYPEAFKKAIVKSLVIHIALLLIAMIGIPKIFLPEAQKPMDVIMVELTKGTSDDIGNGLKAVEHLPENTIEEQKNLMPEAKDVHTTAPQKVEIAKTPPAIDSKAMQDPEKKVKKPQPSGVDAATAAALAKINEQLRQRKITQQQAQTQGTKGYKYGTTDKPINIMNSPDFIKYRAMVKAKITRERLNFGEDKSLKPPAINININASGTIVSKSFARRSGSTSVDAAAMRAVERSSPLPPPPESIKAFVSTYGFTIGF
jgi:protein TonB